MNYRSPKRQRYAVPDRPARPPTTVRQPFNENLANEQPKTTKAKRRSKKPLLIGFVLLAGFGAGVWIYLHKTPDPIPENIRKTANFPILYPSAKYTGINSVAITNNVVTYKIIYKDDEMYASVQSLPKGFDYSNFIQQVSSQLVIRTPLGKATVGKTNGRLIGTMVISNSWFLITATPDTPISDMEMVLMQLKES